MQKKITLFAKYKRPKLFIMNLDDIRFFSPQENKAERKTRTKEDTDTPITGYISATGKVIIPQKAAEEVGLNAEHTTYMVGTQQNKRS